VNASTNGQSGHGDQSDAEHRAEHYFTILSESLTLLAEDTEDADDMEDIIDAVLLELIDAVASQGYKLPRPLMEAIGSWVGTDDPRAYLRSSYSDDSGRIRPSTPEEITAYLTSSNKQYWGVED
jgi:hypothetical protein